MHFMSTMITRDFDHGSLLYQNITNLMGAKQSVERDDLRRKYRSIASRYIPPTKESVSTAENVHPGDKVIDKVNSMLSKLYRTPEQKHFHQVFLASCMRVIYGKDFEKERHRVSNKYKFKSRKQQVLVCCPRRFGKTFSTAFFCVVIAMVLSDIEISIFSPGKRQSVALMGVIVDFCTNWERATVSFSATRRSSASGV